MGLRWGSALSVRRPLDLATLSDVVLSRLVAEGAPYSVEYPLRMDVQPLRRELLAANGAIGEAKLGGIRRFREDLLTLHRVCRETEHDGQRYEHWRTPAR